MFSRLAILLIRAYQASLGAHFGGRCRFHPTCSEYSIEAFRKKGFVVGFALTLRRIVKCGPWHPGGVDLVPDSKTTTA